jgi:hypothetical protein
MEKSKNKIWKTIVILSTVAGILGAIPLIQHWLRKDVSGVWLFDFTTTQSTMNSYVGKTATFEIILHQEEDQITGNGEAIELDHLPLPSDQHNRLDIVSGKIKNGKVEINYILHGALRDSQGTVWVMASDTEMNGTFSGTGAKSSGTIKAKKKH